MAQISPVIRNSDRTRNSARLRRATSAFLNAGDRKGGSDPLEVILSPLDSTGYRVIFSPKPVSGEAVPGYTVAVPNTAGGLIPAGGTANTDCAILGISAYTLVGSTIQSGFLKLNTDTLGTSFSITNGALFFPRWTIQDAEITNAVGSNLLDQDEYGKWLCCNAANTSITMEVAMPSLAPPQGQQSFSLPGSWMGYLDHTGTADLNPLLVKGDNVRQKINGSLTATYTAIDSKYGAAWVLNDRTADGTQGNMLLLKIPGAQDPRTYGTTVTTNSNYSMVYGDRTVLCDTSAGNIQLTLVNSNTYTNKEITLKKTQADANTVTLVMADNALIDGVNTLVINSNFAAATLLSDGADWWIKSTY